MTGRWHPDRFGVTPNRDLGQHFLTEQSVLEWLYRAVDLRADDVALEIGAGLGVLTDGLAARCRHVHAYEVDRRMLRPLDEVRAGHPDGRVTVHLADAAAAGVDFAALDPRVTVMVSNLPYAVAVPIVVRTVEQLPGLRALACLVQAELADRLVAPAGTSSRGAPSAWVELYAVPAGRHAVARAAFTPPPGVDSAMVAFRRRADAPDAEAAAWLKPLVYGGFRHRRKTLANSLATAGPTLAGPDPLRALLAGGRPAVAAVLAAAGVPASARAQDLDADAWRHVAASARAAAHERATAASGGGSAGVARTEARSASPTAGRVGAVRATTFELRAPAKVNVALAVGGRRDDGYHELATVFCAIDLADRLRVEERPGPPAVTVDCAGVDGPNLVAAAYEAFAAAAGPDVRLPALHVRIDKRIPVAGGLGGGSSDAAALLGWLAARYAPRVDAADVAVGLGADVAFFLAGGARFAEGIGERLTAPAVAPAPADLVVCWPRGGRGLSAGAVYGALDDLRSLAALTAQSAGPAVGDADDEGVNNDGFASRRDALRTVAATWAGGGRTAAWMTNDLQPAAEALLAECAAARSAMAAAGIAGAMVSGSGPSVFGWVGGGRRGGGRGDRGPGDPDLAARALDAVAAAVGWTGTVASGPHEPPTRAGLPSAHGDQAAVPNGSERGSRRRDGDRRAR